MTIRVEVFFGKKYMARIIEQDGDTSKVIGALVRSQLRNEFGSTFGHEYLMYAMPGKRNNAVSRAVDTVLEVQGIAPNSDDLWDQTQVYWGVRVDELRKTVSVGD